jgi:hypothetical protein
MVRLGLPVNQPENRKFIEPREAHLDTIIGRQAQKFFTGGKWHRGTLASTDIDVESNEKIWRMEHGDGDRGDHSARGMAAAVVSTESEGEDAGS